MHNAVEMQIRHCINYVRHQLARFCFRIPFPVLVDDTVEQITSFTEREDDIQGAWVEEDVFRGQNVWMLQALKHAHFVQQDSDVRLGLKHGLVLLQNFARKRLAAQPLSGSIHGAVLSFSENSRPMDVVRGGHDS